jgi:hypothetical protein
VILEGLTETEIAGVKVTTADPLVPLAEAVIVVV